jgi:hypothetical protein
MRAVHRLSPYRQERSNPLGGERKLRLDVIVRELEAPEKAQPDLSP